MFFPFPLWCPGSGVALDCVDSRSLPSFLLCQTSAAFESEFVQFYVKGASTTKLHFTTMRGPRKFCQRGSNFESVFFLVDEGRKDPDTTISGPSSVRQRNAFKWRFAGGPMMARCVSLAG